MNGFIDTQSARAGWRLWLAASRETASERLVFGVLAVTSVLAIGLAFAPMLGLSLAAEGGGADGKVKSGTTWKSPLPLQAPGGSPVMEKTCNSSLPKA